MDVSFEVIDRDQRLFQRKSECLGIAYADQQCSRESRPLSYGESVNGFVTLSGLRQSLPYYGHDRAQMLTRRQLGNHTSIGLVSCDLRGNNIGDDLLART